jgi:DNA-binding response OmpR family regulator
MIASKILFFCADDSLIHIVTHSLIAAGYKVIIVNHGIGALEIIQSEKPSLIILDATLPGLSSIAIIRALRSEEGNSTTPVILMGEDLREEDVLLGLEVGADLCLLEAFHPEVFVARIRSLLRRVEPQKAQ